MLPLQRLPRAAARQKDGQEVRPRPLQLGLRPEGRGHEPEPTELAEAQRPDDRLLSKSQHFKSRWL